MASQTVPFPPLLLLLLSFIAGSASTSPGRPTALWCVAKNNADDAALQLALDWACGPGGADCGPIQKGGPCYDPSDIQRTASFAFNDYFLKHGVSDDSCSFNNTAAVTSLNPSHNDCKFPSSLSRAGGDFNESSAMGSGNVDDLANSVSVTHCRHWGSIAGHFLLIIVLNMLCGGNEVGLL